MLETHPRLGPRNKPGAVRFGQCEPLPRIYGHLVVEFVISYFLFFYRESRKAKKAGSNRSSSPEKRAPQRFSALLPKIDH